MINVKQVFVVAVGTALAAGGTACSAGDTNELPKEKGVQWSCGIQGSARVVCSTAQASSIAPGPAYSCSSGESSDQCPDEETVQDVPGLRDAIEAAGGGDDFNDAPWACLVTGKDQIQCTRSCGNQTGGAAVEGAGGGGDFHAPTLPTSCAPTAWEPYFAELASFQYHLNGVDIDFPREIFDANAPLLEQPPLLGGTVQGTEISCHTGEWAMRSQAWLDAVLKGCVNLAGPILVLCQQAANYAPTTGKCSATGTW